MPRTLADSALLSPASSIPPFRKQLTVLRATSILEKKKNLWIFLEIKGQSPSKPLFYDFFFKWAKSLGGLISQTWTSEIFQGQKTVPL